MLAYHCNRNFILVEPFRSKHDHLCLAAYNKICRRIKQRGQEVNLQVLDNESSTECHRTIKEEWNIAYQLVTLNVHRRNISELSIRTFKTHFLSILAGVYVLLPNYI